MPAWLLSVVLHLTLLLGMGFLAPTLPLRRGIEADRHAGITLVQAHAEQRRYFSPESSQDDSALSDESAALPAAATAAVTAAVELPTAAAPIPGSRDTLWPPAAGSLTAGFGQTSRVDGGQTSTSVFGAEARGSKFVYVFDRSLSMSGFQGRPMAAARQELIASLSNLQSVHQFQIVFYNEGQTVLNPLPSHPPTMLFASEANKALADTFIQNTPPLGATRHLEALELALKLKPDVIFFLTDAADPQLTPAQLERIRRRNAGQSSIHTIEFGSGPFPGGRNFLVRLAQQNAGHHVYVDVTQLEEQ